MTSTISRQEQYALVAWIAKEVGGTNRRLGKKAFQKNVHLLQELGGIDAGYRFSFYTYGPYSASLAGDLDTVAALGGVLVNYNSADNYYLITPGAEADRIIDKGREFVQRHRGALDRILHKFGARSAKELELVSTIVYLRRHAPPDVFESDQKLLERVKALKPKYSNDEIRSAIREVKSFIAEEARTCPTPSRTSRQTSSS